MSVGGKIVQVYRDEERQMLWLNTYDGKDYCSLYVGIENDVWLNDKMWWQGGNCMWTRLDTKGEPVFVEKVIQKQSGSGVAHPLGKEFELKPDFYESFKKMKEERNEWRKRFNYLYEHIKSSFNHLLDHMKGHLD